MKKSARIFLVTATILFTQVAALAMVRCPQNPEVIFLYRTGFYVAGSGSIDWNLSNKVFLEVNGVSASGKVTPDTSFNANLAVGYYMDQWRLEVEGNYRNRKDTAFSLGGVTVTDFGYVSQYSVMANVFYDIPLCVKWWGFYLGAGVGCAFSDIEVTGILSAHRSDARFAGQAIAGTFYHINRCIALTLAYRIFATTSPEDYFFTNNVANVTVSAESSPITQSVELGIRISL